MALAISRETRDIVSFQISSAAGQYLAHKLFKRAAAKKLPEVTGKVDTGNLEPPEDLDSLEYFNGPFLGVAECDRVRVVAEYCPWEADKQTCNVN